MEQREAETNMVAFEKLAVEHGRRKWLSDTRDLSDDDQDWVVETIRRLKKITETDSDSSDDSAEQSSIERDDIEIDDIRSDSGESTDMEMEV